MGISSTDVTRVLEKMTLEGEKQLALIFTYQQPLMADDNDNYENECDENCIFVYLPCARHYA